ncbi:diacylglycerol kinase family protein [Paenibacillus sp. FSL R7-0204]|uniref:diacylglycerol/lipid kinase family protein n=1 Tax=Paenibacillus sp. FSL R7-0204 TaxID=2921675 RepID=UPI0030FCC0DA
MQQAMVIMNPSSGKAEARDYIRAAEEVLQGAGYQVTVQETAGEGDATAFCLQACAECYDLVVAIGGDGTLHETMNGLTDQQHRPTLGIVPMGTVNDFARALQIPLVPEEAIQSLASPRTRRVDMGRMNDRLFVNVVAAGSLAGSLSSVSSEDKSRLGFLAYLKEGIKELASNTAHTLTITHDGEIWEGSSPLFIAALTNSVGGFEKLAPAAAVDDGLLHCFIVKDLHLLNSVTVSISLLLGNLRNHKDVIYFTAKEVSVRSTEPVQTNVDGEQGPPLPIRLSTIPRHIQVVVPED